MKNKRRGTPFKRNKSQKSPRRKQSILLICEGEVTEFTYFKALKQEYRLQSFTLEFLFPGGPTSIAQEAVNQKRYYDYVWAVFDRNEHSGYEQAVQRCHDAGIGVAYSNPCLNCG